MKPFPHFYQRKSPLFQVVKYHRVLPDNDDFAIDVVTSQEFENQIKILSSYFNLISLNELFECLQSGTLLANSICLTFDDGYRDNYTYALPILQKYNVHATIFLTTGIIGTNKMLWHDKVLRVLRDTKVSTLTYKKANLDNVDVENRYNRKMLALRLLEWLKQFSPSQRDEYILELCDLCQVADGAGERLMLNWEEISQMQTDNISFGAHTVSHPILSSLKTGLIEREIIDSKMMIEERLNCNVNLFAYPNGKTEDYDDRCKKILKKAGFLCAFTTKSGVNSKNTDFYELFRTSPWDQNLNRFYGRLILERAFASL